MGWERFARVRNRGTCSRPGGYAIRLDDLPGPVDDLDSRLPEGRVQRVYISAVALSSYGSRGGEDLFRANRTVAVVEQAHEQLDLRPCAAVDTNLEGADLDD